MLLSLSVSSLNPISIIIVLSARLLLIPYSHFFFIFLDQPRAESRGHRPKKEGNTALIRESNAEPGNKSMNAPSSFKDTHQG